MNADIAQVDQLLNGAVTREAAPAAIESLRTARLAGQVDESAYLTRSDYLHAVASGQQVEAPNRFPTQEQRLAAMVDETMAPGKPHEYRIERDPMLPALDDAGLAIDTAIRESLTALAVPARLGGTIVERAEHVAKAMENLSPADRQGQIETFQADLRRTWGADYQKNADLITDFVARAAESNELLGHILDNAVWVLADKYIAESLLSIAKHQKTRR